MEADNIQYDTWDLTIREGRTKACKNLLKSHSFRKDVNLRKKTEESHPDTIFFLDETTHVDHVVDLETVATCFSQCYSQYSLAKCLTIMCSYEELLNNKYNLCLISEDLNQKKRTDPKSQEVQDYLSLRFIEENCAVLVHEN